MAGLKTAPRDCGRALCCCLGCTGALVLLVLLPALGAGADGGGVSTTAVNQPPVVAAIPGQTVNGGGGFFQAIMLDDYVDDPDHPDAELAWTATGASMLEVTIVDRVATVRSPGPDWTGTETIVFTATDPLGLADSAAATFAVRGYYNSPAHRLAITEVNLSNWTSQVQVVDVTGGSTVDAYYDCGAQRRGPFRLWENLAAGAGQSVTFANIVQTIDDLDPGVFDYQNTSGALELVTQDDDHLVQASVRTRNAGTGGNNSRTFPALADVETNTAGGSEPGMLLCLDARQLLVPNLSNDAEYRPSVVLFNPGDEPASAQVTLYDSTGTVVTTVTRGLAPHEMNVITDELRKDTYSHATALVEVTGSTGRVMASGQTAHYGSEDPAAHLAVQVAEDYANSPDRTKSITEVNWTSMWVSEVQIIDVTGGASVEAYYSTGAERRGPFKLWASTRGAYSSVTLPNILQTMDALDPGPAQYYMTSGTLELRAHDSGHQIHAAVRTHNGVGHSRTFPALGGHPANRAAWERPLLIPGMSNDSDYRSSVVLYNPTAKPAAATIGVWDGTGAQVGTTIARALAPYEMNVITDELRANVYSNAVVRIEVAESGDGKLLVTGQTANMHSNDPAGHIAVQAE